jgi:ABC-type transporter Mla MlaB component
MAVAFAADVCTHARPAQLTLVGELDQAGVAELETMFRWVGAMYGQSHVVIDVSALEFCDSAGWHALERCLAKGAALSGSPACLRRLFYLIEHSHLLPSELHEMRGLEPGARERLSVWMAKAA